VILGDPLARPSTARPAIGGDIRGVGISPRPLRPPHARVSITLPIRPRIR
jgi:hypothetical protein